MDNFWKNALKVGGVITVGLFVFWYFGKEIISKFSYLNQEYTLILAGLLIVLTSIIIFRLIKKESKIDNNHNNKIIDSIENIKKSEINIGAKDSDNHIERSINNVENSTIRIG